MVRDFVLGLFAYSFVVDVANLGAAPVAVALPDSDKRVLNGEIPASLISFFGTEHE